MAYAREYKKQLILITSAIVLVIIVFSGIMYSFQRSENTAALLVSKALTQYATINDPGKGYAETRDAFENIFADYANTVAGRLAKVKFAKICYDAAEYDQSYQYYKQSLETLKKDVHMENFILVSLGYVCVARNDFEAAEKYFLQIEQGKTNVLKDEAKYALATLYEKKANVAESRKMYESIVSDYAASMYRPMAESKINQIK